MTTLARLNSPTAKNTPPGTAARRRLAHTSTAITRATTSLTVIFALSGPGRDSTAEPSPTRATPVTSWVRTPCSIARFITRPSRAPSCASQPPSSDASPTKCSATSTLYSTSTICPPDLRHSHPRCRPALGGGETPWLPPGNHIGHTARRRRPTKVDTVAGNRRPLATAVPATLPLMSATTRSHALPEQPHAIQRPVWAATGPSQPVFTDDTRIHAAAAVARLRRRACARSGPRVPPAAVGASARDAAVDPVPRSDEADRRLRRLLGPPGERRRRAGARAVPGHGGALRVPPSEAHRH